MWRKNIFLHTENSLVQLLTFITKIPTSSHHCSIHAGFLCFFFVFRWVNKGQLAAVASCFHHDLKGSLEGFYWETFHLRCYWNFRSSAAAQVWVLLIFLILKVLPVWSCVLQYCNRNDAESFSKSRIFRGIWKVKHGCLHILLAQLLLGFPAVICRQGEVLWAYRPNSGCSGRPQCFFWQKLWTFSSINPLIMWTANFLKLLIYEKLRVHCLRVINVNCVCKLYLCYIR